MYIYTWNMYIQVTHFAVCLKLTQYDKSTILQYKLEKKKKTNQKMQGSVSSCDVLD